MSDMSDFEQWLERQDEEEASMFSSQWRVGWQAAKQSMQAEQVGAVMNAGCIYVGNLKPGLADGTPLYPHAPDSAARIAEIEAENEALQKELDAHKKSIDYVSDLYRPNKSRSWVMQILREHIDAYLNIKGGAE